MSLFSASHLSKRTKKAFTFCMNSSRVGGGFVMLQAELIASGSV